MLEQYLTNPEDQNRLKMVLQNIKETRQGAKVLIFQGAAGTGKSTFYRALRKAIAKATCGAVGLQNRETVIPASLIKASNDMVFVYDCYKDDPVYTDTSLSRRAFTFHFTTNFLTSPQRVETQEEYDRVIETLKDDLLSMME